MDSTPRRRRDSPPGSWPDPIAFHPGYRAPIWDVVALRRPLHRSSAGPHLARVAAPAGRPPPRPGGTRAVPARLLRYAPQRHRGDPDALRGPRDPTAHPLLRPYRRRVRLLRPMLECLLDRGAHGTLGQVEPRWSVYCTDCNQEIDIVRLLLGFPHYLVERPSPRSVDRLPRSGQGPPGARRGEPEGADPGPRKEGCVASEVRRLREAGRDDPEVRALENLRREFVRAAAPPEIADADLAPPVYAIRFGPDKTCSLNLYCTDPAGWHPLDSADGGCYRFGDFDGITFDLGLSLYRLQEMFRRFLSLRGESAGYQSQVDADVAAMERAIESSRPIRITASPSTATK